MSNTPLEQNGINLDGILTAINNLPEYDPPDPTYDFFSLYSATIIAEYLDTINIADDTSFDPTVLTDGTWTTIRAGTSASLEKSVEVNLDDYIYIATQEWYSLPEYTEERPSVSYEYAKAGIDATIYTNNGVATTISALKQLYMLSSGYIAENTNNYGILWYSGSYVSLSNSRIYLTERPLSVRPSSALASVASLQALDVDNTNIYVRQRVYRVPHDQFINLMQTMCEDMINNAAFDVEEVE